MGSFGENGLADAIQLSQDRLYGRVESTRRRSGIGRFYALRKIVGADLD
jgi:hypothetical protein